MLSEISSQTESIETSYTDSNPRDTLSEISTQIAPQQTTSSEMSTQTAHQETTLCEISTQTAPQETTSSEISTQTTSQETADSAKRLLVPDLPSHQNQQLCPNQCCQHRGSCFFIKCSINAKLHITSHYSSCDVHLHLAASACLASTDPVSMDNSSSSMENGFTVHKQRNNYYIDSIDFLDMRGKKSADRANQDYE